MDFNRGTDNEHQRDAQESRLLRGANEPPMEDTVDFPPITEPILEPATPESIHELSRLRKIASSVGSRLLNAVQFFTGDNNLRH